MRMAIKDRQNVPLRNNLFPDFIFGLHSTSHAFFQFASIYLAFKDNLVSLYSCFAFIFILTLGIFQCFSFSFAGLSLLTSTKLEFRFAII